MSIYGKAALRAVELYKKGVEKDPVQAWQSAIAQFTKSTSSRDKPCPKNTFLGLCSDGLIVGIPEGDYLTKPDSVERVYASKAVEYLKDNPQNLVSPTKLWAAIGNANKHHNRQMDVVLALWNGGLINNENGTGAPRAGV